MERESSPEIRNFLSLFFFDLHLHGNWFCTKRSAFYYPLRRVCLFPTAVSAIFRFTLFRNLSPLPKPNFDHIFIYLTVFKLATYTFLINLVYYYIKLKKIFIMDLLGWLALSDSEIKTKNYFRKQTQCPCF